MKHMFHALDGLQPCKIIGRTAFVKYGRAFQKVPWDCGETFATPAAGPTCLSRRIPATQLDK